MAGLTEGKGIPEETLFVEGGCTCPGTALFQRKRGIAGILNRERQGAPSSPSQPHPQWRYPPWFTTWGRCGVCVPARLLPGCCHDCPHPRYGVGWGGVAEEGHTGIRPPVWARPRKVGARDFMKGFHPAGLRCFQVSTDVCNSTGRGMGYFPSRVFDKMASVTNNALISLLTCKKSDIVKMVDGRIYHIVDTSVVACWHGVHC